MTTKSNGDSNVDFNSPTKWKTEFKEITEARSLPTYLENELGDHVIASSSSPGTDSPLQELISINRSQSSSGVPADRFLIGNSARSGSSGSVSSSHSSLTQGSSSPPRAASSPRSGTLDSEHGSGGVELVMDESDYHELDVKATPPSSLRPPRGAASNISLSGSVVSSEYNTPNDVMLSMTMEGEISQVRRLSPPSSLKLSSNVSPSSQTSTPRTISVDLSLSKIESKPVVAELDDSLDLFTDMKKNSAKVPPARPPKPKLELNEQSHPLMIAPEPEPEFESFFESKTPEPPKSSGLSAKISKTASYINKKRSKFPNVPMDEGDKNPVEVSTKEEIGSSENVETTLQNETDEVNPQSETNSSSSKKQKFKALKSHLMYKAYNKYSQLNEYYYGNKKQHQLQGKTLEEAEDAKSDRVRGSSESESEGGFYEITNEDVTAVETPSEVSSSDESDVAYMGTPEETSVAEPTVVTPSGSPSTELANNTPSDPSTTIHPTPNTHQSDMAGSYQKHLMCSGLVGVVSILVYLTVYHCSYFLQGMVVGILIPVVGGVVVLLKTRSSITETSMGLRAALQCNRLRKLGAKSSLKDFFQYTESHNFGDLRIKNLPYRYFKLKGTFIEAYELNATKDQVPDPLRLTHSEVKSYGMKLVFRIDISGWLVSVEAPPGSTITASNMWKKRYPIWLRKINWRSESAEYDAGLTVNSFYLIATYSRYKEHWYEALRKAVSLNSEQKNLSSTEQENYRDFMERLFHQLPTSTDSPVPLDNGDNSGDQVVSEVHSKLPDMQYTAWVNALFGRFVWNILTDVQWEKRIRDRIVRKLSSVSTRHISSIELKSFDLGDSVPLITKTYLPKIDHQGVWTEMDLDWSGQVSLSLVARLNSKPAGQGDNSRTFEPMKLESERATDNASSGKLAKLYKILERIEIGVSAQITRVAGRLCVNIPPPPTDCVWYGFTQPPELKIQLTPIIGRWISLDYRPITNALEKQLQSLFNDTFVLPAMENLVAPGMSRDMEMRQEYDSLPPPTINMDLLEATDQDLLDVAATSRRKTVL